MSSNRLGKGLGALIRSNEIEEKKTKNKNTKGKNSAISNILLKHVKPNPNQPRRYFDNNALEELILSIQEKGVITPITVREIKEGYEIIAGVFSRKPKLSISFGKSIGIAKDRCYSNYKEMAEKESVRLDGIDVVSIVTPNHCLLYTSPSPRD